MIRKENETTIIELGHGDVLVSPAKEGMVLELINIPPFTPGENVKGKDLPRDGEKVVIRAEGGRGLNGFYALLRGVFQVCAGNDKQRSEEMPYDSCFICCKEDVKRISIYGIYLCEECVKVAVEALNQGGEK